MSSARRPFRLFAAVIAASAISAARAEAGGTGYTQVNLVSDIAATALNTDVNLKGPWGMASGPGSPIWVADAGTSVATLYKGDGTVVPLVVSFPIDAGPTGVVFNPTTDFADNGSTRLFIFASLHGTIFGWSSGTSAVAEASTPGAVYTGITIGNNGANHLYAANVSAGTIDAYDSSFALTALKGFTDPNLPAGYTPFNVQNIGGTLFVTYQNGSNGAGHGIVNEFNLDGQFVKRLISPGGALNTPWGLAVAPADFGDLSGELLVANVGDGKINGFDMSTGALDGTLADAAGDPIVIDRLQGLFFGNDGNGGKHNELFFTAGINSGADGLFGKLVPNLPDLTIAKSHSGDFVLGQIGGIYSIVVTNAGIAPTTGTVTVTDALPAGLSATGMSGTGWSCSVATLTCTRSDALAAGASYPAITLAVDVDPSAPASLTNAAAVSGGGETNTANDSASDPTTVTAAPPSIAPVPTLQWPLLVLFGMLLAGAGLLTLQR